MEHICAVAAALLLVLSPAHGRDFVTLTGKVYQNATITRVEPAGINIMYAGGTAFINFAELPSEVRAEFAQAEADADSIQPAPNLARATEFRTVDGQVYRDVTVTRIERTGLRISHRDGISFIDFHNVPTASRERYGYSHAAYTAGLGAKLLRERVNAEVQSRTVAEATARQIEAQRKREQLLAVALLAAQRIQAAPASSTSAITERNYAATDYSKRNYATDRYTSDRYTGGTVHVSGYTRKDGTYVRPYTRRK